METTSFQILRGRDAKLFMALCTLVYFTSYITRINYGAVITELIGSLDITKSGAGLVSTAAFFTYGAGQIVSGVIGDRVRPGRMIAVGLAATSVCNLGMTLCRGVLPMALLWGVNGLCQAMFWPPLVKLMAENLSSSDYSRACVMVSAGSSVGTIAVYLSAPLLIGIGGWQTVFAVSAVCGIAMAIIWSRSAVRLRLNSRLQSIRNDAPRSERGRLGNEAALMLVFICAAIVMQGILRDGVTTWMPTFISERFGLSAKLSILTGVALPLFSIFSFNLAAYMQKRLGSELLCSMILFAGGGSSALAMRLFGFGDGAASAAFCVLMMSILTGCMHGINLMLVSRTPAYFSRGGKISIVSGLVNAFTYVGSALSSYCFAALSEGFGWGVTVLIWAVIALLGAVICSLCRRRWDAFKRTSVF